MVLICQNDLNKKYKMWRNKSAYKIVVTLFSVFYVKQILGEEVGTDNLNRIIIIVIIIYLVGMTTTFD
jgi:hypothetical protein